MAYALKCKQRFRSTCNALVAIFERTKGSVGAVATAFQFVPTVSPQLHSARAENWFVEIFVHLTPIL